MLRKLMLAVVSLLLMVPAAVAENISGAEMPDLIQAGNQALQLNGAGMRTKFFFKVYAGGLYLQQAGQSDSAAILSTDQPMAIRMVWMRDVPGDKLIDGWNSGFAHSTQGAAQFLQGDIDKFNAVFKNGAKKNEVHDIVYEPETGITIYKDSQMVEQIPDKNFKNAVFGIWLGDKTEVPDLRDKMLGK